MPFVCGVMYIDFVRIALHLLVGMHRCILEQVKTTTCGVKENKINEQIYCQKKIVNENTTELQKKPDSGNSRVVFLTD